MLCLRRIERIRWTEHVTNLEVLNRDGIKKQLFNKIRKHKQTLFLASDKKEYNILEGIAEDKKGIGRFLSLLLTVT